LRRAPAAQGLSAAAAPADRPRARSDRTALVSRHARDVRMAAETARDVHSPEATPMHIQMGPSHPASHRTVKFNLELDGETVVKVGVEVGYLPRAFEKMCEQGTWNHSSPYADRLNYASPLLNNVGFALAVEQLADLPVPERCQYIRVIVGEISRITDHLTCL